MAMGSAASGGADRAAPSILCEIAGRARLRAQLAERAEPSVRLRDRALALAQRERAGAGPPSPPPFERALAGEGLSLICEVKRASPSKGVIAEEYPYLEIARGYEAGGAAAVSVLTEPEFFLGEDRHLSEIAAELSIPALRKDFVVCERQIYEAKLLGAGAALLICALLDDGELRAFAGIAGELGMSALFEIHSEAEAERALRAGARIVGVNSRDLRTFAVDFALSARLRGSIPPGALAVAESGVRSPADIAELRRAGFDAALVGESLMRAPDRRRFLGELLAAALPEGAAS